MRLIHLLGLVLVLIVAVAPVSAYRFYHPEHRYPAYNGYGAPLQGPFGPYYIEDVPGADYYVTPGGTFAYNHPGYSWSPYHPSGDTLRYPRDSTVNYYPYASFYYAPGHYQPRYQRPFWPRQYNHWYGSEWYLHYPTKTYYNDWYRSTGGFPNPNPDWQH